MELIAGVLCALIAVVFVALPLFEGSQAKTASQRTEPEQEWERRKREALAAIKEAEFDLAMGKMSEEDFAALRERYLEIAAKAVAERTQNLGGAEAGRKTEASQEPDTCPHCAAVRPPAGKFCAACGQSLAA